MPCETSMATHTKEQHEYIVRMLAALYSPRDIAVAFALRFRDTACSENDVSAIDPRFAVVDPDLHALFHRERAAFENDPTLPPTASKTIRLRLLDRQAERCLAENRPNDLRSVLRQIAEEQADAIEPTNPDDEIIEIVETIVDPVAPAGAA